MKAKICNKYVTVTVYEACDGTEFDTIEACMAHEASLKSKKEQQEQLMQKFFKIERIKEIDGYGLDIQDSDDVRYFRWFLPKNKHELDVIIDVYGGEDNIYFYNDLYEKEYVGIPICVASNDDPYNDPAGNLNTYENTSMMSFVDRVQYFAQIGKKLGYNVVTTRQK